MYVLILLSFLSRTYENKTSSSVRRAGGRWKREEESGKTQNSLLAPNKNALLCSLFAFCQRLLFISSTDLVGVALAVAAIGRRIWHLLGIVVL